MWKLKEHVLIVFGRRWEDSPSNELHTLYWLCGCITSQVIRLMTHIQDIWILVTSNHGLMTSAWAYIMICVAVCQLEVVFQDSDSLETLRELWKVIPDSLFLKGAVEFQCMMTKFQHPWCIVVTVVQIDKQLHILEYLWNMREDHAKFLETWKKLRRTMPEQSRVEVSIAGLRLGKRGDMSNRNPGWLLHWIPN